MSELTPGDRSNPKKAVIPRFYIQSVPQPFLSKEAGRPICKDVEYVEIIIPGDRNSKVVEPVNDEHRERWIEHYAAFKRGQDMPREGTPLRNWPHSQMTPARIEELAYFHIQTVDELANVNDNLLGNLGMGSRELREAARKFLDVAKNGTAPLERMIARIEDLSRENARLVITNENLKAENERLLNQIKEMSHARL